jgi:recombination associated protein RdgC
LFKNLIVYRIGPDWSATVEHMEEALAPARFVECGATQQKSIGWIEPRGEKHGALVESIGGQRILKLQIETKAVPGSVVKRKAQEQIEHIEATTGRKPGKREIKDIRDDALLALLPMAFTKQSSVQVWIDLASRLLMTDAGSQAKADEVITALVSALPGLPLTAAADDGVAAGRDDAVADRRIARGSGRFGLSVERECELKSNDEEKSVVKFTRHNLLNDEIRHHVAQGKLPVKLALSWDGRVAFVLTEALQLKKDQLSGRRLRRHLGRQGRRL